MVAEELKVIVKAEVDKAVRNMKRFQGETDKTAKKTGGLKKGFNTLKSSGILAFASVGTAVFKAGQFIGDSIRVATEAQETYSKFNTVFESIASEANKTAEAFEESFGLAGSTARELLGDTGDILVGFGATEEQALSLSEQVNALAVDLASYSNFAGGAKGASEALTSALLGERERVKQLGIVIREADVQQRLLENGQDHLTGTALSLARAQATLEIATEQSTKAQGDYERTANSAANVNRRLEEQTKELKENIGAFARDGLTPLKQAWNEVLDVVNEYISKNNELIGLNELTKQNNLTVQESYQKLEGQIKLLEEANERLGRNDRAARRNKEEIQTNMRLISMLKVQIERLKEWEKIQAEAADAEKEKNDELEREISVQQRIADAYSNINDELVILEQQKQLALDLGQEFNEDEEKRKIITGEINKLIKEGYKVHWPGVATAIEGILESYDLLIENQSNIEKQLEEGIIPQAEIAAARWEAWADASDDVNNKLTITKDTILPGIGMAIINTKKNMDSLNDTTEFFNALLQTTMSSTGTVFEEMGRALIDTEKGWVDVGKTAVKAVASILRSLGEQAAVQAAMAYAALNIPGGVAWTAASIAAFVGSGVVDALAGQITTAATGADFITSGPQMMLVGDNPGGRERVSVTPVSSQNINGPGGGTVIMFNAPIYGIDGLAKTMNYASNKLASRGRL